MKKVLIILLMSGCGGGDRFVGDAGVADTQDSTTKDLASAPKDLASAPKDLAIPSIDLAPLPKDLAPSPIDLAPPPKDLAPPLKDLAPPLKDLAPLPKDLAPTPVDLAPPPKDLAPPVDLAPPPPDAAPTGAALFEWITVFGGEFMMGAALDSACALTRGQVLTKVGRFRMMRYEVTKDLRNYLNGPQPYTACEGADCPAQVTSWGQAAKACERLNTLEGLPPCYLTCGHEKCSYVAPDLTKCGYRLPTRAEFEYAYRAGTTTEFYNGPASATQCVGATKAALIGWYDWNSPDRRASVIGQKLPNAWGFFDLAGNAREWVHDACVGGHYTMGGSYLDGSPRLQAGYTMCTASANPVIDAGFRCVRSF